MWPVITLGPLFTPPSKRPVRAGEGNLRVAQRHSLKIAGSCGAETQRSPILKPEALIFEVNSRLEETHCAAVDSVPIFKGFLPFAAHLTSVKVLQSSTPSPAPTALLYTLTPGWTGSVSATVKQIIGQIHRRNAEFLSA